MHRYLKALAVTAIPAFLAACGSSDEDYLVEACVEDGQSRAVCECTADVMSEALSSDQLAMMAAMSRMRAEDGLSEQEAQAKMMEDYTMGELLTLGMASIEPSMKAANECE
ncbi:MAG: hypothetical protein ACE363_05410 [Alphaproteobacteria bacterium]